MTRGRRAVRERSTLLEQVLRTGPRRTAFARATSSTGTRRGWRSSASVAAIRSHTSSACSLVRDLPQVERRQRRILLAGEDQRQRDRAVEQVRPAVLSGARGRAAHVQQVIEHLERDAEVLAERLQRLRLRRPSARPRARPAGTRPRTGSRSSGGSAARSAPPSHVVAVGVVALRQLAHGQRQAGVGEHADLALVVVRGEERERAREHEVAGGGRGLRGRGSRTRWRVPARRAARSTTSSCTSVAMCTSSTAAAARTGRLALVPAGTQQHEQRPQALAAGGSVPAAASASASPWPAAISSRRRSARSIRAGIRVPAEQHDVVHGAHRGVGGRHAAGMDCHDAARPGRRTARRASPRRASAARARARAESAAPSWAGTCRPRGRRRRCRAAGRCGRTRPRRTTSAAGAAEW